MNELRRAESILVAITTPLWAGNRSQALDEVRRHLTIKPASRHQQADNHAGLEIRLGTDLCHAYALPNLGAADHVLAGTTERRWLRHLRWFSATVDVTVVKKWQNAVVYHRKHDEATLRALVEMQTGWLADDFYGRHVRQVEHTIITLVPHQRPLMAEQWWHLFLDDGRTVIPGGTGNSAFASFLDALYVAVAIKQGQPLARYAQRPYRWDGS